MIAFERTGTVGVSHSQDPAAGTLREGARTNIREVFVPRRRRCLWPVA